jgi:hypothetical protein
LFRVGVANAEASYVGNGVAPGCGDGGCEEFAEMVRVGVATGNAPGRGGGGKVCDVRVSVRVGVAVAQTPDRGGGGAVCGVENAGAGAAEVLRTGVDG